MKKVYIVLTYSGTLLSNIIKMYTKKSYSHVSISLDSSLSTMYSFGRKNPYISFLGGFVEESKDFGTFKRFYKTKCRVYELEVTNKQYHKIKRTLKRFIKNKNGYKYDLVGVMLFPFNIKFVRKNHYYCSDFVKYLLNESKISKTLPDLTKPEDIPNHIKNKKIIYEGLLKNYTIV